MNAKEMFESLGYKELSSQLNEIDRKYHKAYAIDDDVYKNRAVWFNFETKTFICYGKDDRSECVNMYLLQAIYQECKELGWLK